MVFHRHDWQERGEWRANAGNQRWGEPVDYIIFGLGAGSSLVLIGWLFRDWGPALRDRKARSDVEVLAAHQMVAQMRWARFCGSCGTALAIGGAFMLVATIIGFLMNPTDARGAMIVLSAFAIVSVAMLVWSWLFVSRFGIDGIFRRKVASVATDVSTGDNDRLDEDNDDFGFSPGTTVAESRAPAAVSISDIRPEIPNADAAPIAVPDLGERADVPDRSPMEEQPEPVVAIDDDQTEVEEKADDAEEASGDEVIISEGDDVRTADAEVTSDFVVPEGASSPDELAIGSGRSDDNSSYGNSEDQENDDAAETAADDATSGLQIAEHDGAPDLGDEPDGGTAEKSSGRDEALQNLRKRRLGRLTRN